MKKTIDNGCTMPYNNHCCAGVAHLVERDLAKVEVASSSLVAMPEELQAYAQPMREIFRDLQEKYP